MKGEREVKDLNFVSRHFTSAIQSAFARIRLKDYIDVLEELSGKDGFYRHQYEQIKEYTRLNECCLYDFYPLETDDIPSFNEDVTIGEMLYAASEIFKDADRTREYCELDDDGTLQERAGREIVMDLVLLPLSDEAILDKIETIINGKEK